MPHGVGACTTTTPALMLAMSAVSIAEGFRKEQICLPNRCTLRSRVRLFPFSERQSPRGTTTTAWLGSLLYLQHLVCPNAQNKSNSWPHGPQRRWIGETQTTAAESRPPIQGQLKAETSKVVASNEGNEGKPTIDDVCTSET